MVSTPRFYASTNVLFTRLAAVPTFVLMTVAIMRIKIPIWLGHGFGPFGARDVPYYGFLSMAHEMRTDWAMLLGSPILIVAGAGPWSLDAWRTGRNETASGSPAGAGPSS